LKSRHGFISMGLGVLLLGALGFGCTPGVSREARSQVTYEGPFSQLQQAPQEYMGETVMLGGEIIETIPATDSSQIVVLQLPLDGERPGRQQQTAGRFIVRAPQFLDPAIYNKGTLLTVVGRVGGSEPRPIGAYEYRYPLIDAIELRLWPEEERRAYPRVHFGIGIGTRF
jgi:outer membrane lipoprotein